MGFATHLGPWLLGTVKNTTGTTAGTIENLGATVVSQTFKKNYSGAAFDVAATDTICVLPAGAQIVSIFIDTLVAFTGSTAANVVVGTSATTNLFWASSDITTQGRLANTNAASKLANWAGATSTASPNGIGIGSTDVIVQAVLTPTIADVTAGTVQYTIVYVVANSNGAQFPSATQQ
jgi:predicted membrane protein